MFHFKVLGRDEVGYEFNATATYRHRGTGMSNRANIAIERIVRTMVSHTNRGVATRAAEHMLTAFKLPLMLLIPGEIPLWANERQLKAACGHSEYWHMRDVIKRIVEHEVEPVAALASGKVKAASGNWHGGKHHIYTKRGSVEVQKDEVRVRLPDQGVKDEGFMQCRNIMVNLLELRLLRNNTVNKARMATLLEKMDQRTPIPIQVVIS